MAERRGNDDRLERDLGRMRWVLWLFGAVSGAGVLIFALSLGLGTWSAGLSHVGGGMLVATAFTLLGALIGFLFGIPRSLQPESAGDAAVFRVRVNTNLEQISDWLTKIFVGVGLTELRSIPGALQRLAVYVSGALGGAAYESVAFAVVLVSLIFGFFTGYLLTRTHLAQLFKQTDGALDDDARATVDAAVDPASIPPALNPSFDSSVKKAAANIIQSPLNDLKGQDDLVTWARAQFASGDLKSAALGYGRALEHDPDNPKLLRDQAVVLSRAGQRSKAIDLLNAALKQPGASTADQQRIVENLMFNHLYEKPPDGFEAVIELGERSETERTPAVYAYLASAHGQSYAHHLAAKDLKEEELAEIRLKALNATRKAAVAPEWKRVLRSLWKNTPGGNPDENDLAAFAADPEFKTLLD